MIEIYHASVNYGKEVKALQDINVIIDRGEFVFVVGSSGAGKSTLLKLINREVVPSKGTVKVFGRDLTLMKRRHVPFLRRNIGMVFQDFRLLKDRNVFDNVAFALLVIGASRREINRRVPATLELVNLQDKAKKFPDQLSGGEQQRVALARAIVNRPALILADEPTGNLDRSSLKYESTPVIFYIFAQQFPHYKYEKFCFYHLPFEVLFLFHCLLIIQPLLTT